MSETLDWLPPHKCGLYLEHNRHKDVYEKAEEHYGHIADDEWVSPEEKARAFAMDSVWVLQWYPTTPIGSFLVAASSLDAIRVSVSTPEEPT